MSIAACLDQINPGPNNRFARMQHGSDAAIVVMYTTDALVPTAIAAITAVAGKFERPFAGAGETTWQRRPHLKMRRTRRSAHCPVVFPWPYSLGNRLFLHKKLTEGANSFGILFSDCLSRHPYEVDKFALASSVGPISTAVEAARTADVAVLFLGEPSDMNGESTSRANRRIASPSVPCAGQVRLSVEVAMPGFGRMPPCRFLGLTRAANIEKDSGTDGQSKKWR